MKIFIVIRVIYNILKVNYKIILLKLILIFSFLFELVGKSVLWERKIMFK